MTSPELAIDKQQVEASQASPWVEAMRQEDLSGHADKLFDPENPYTTHFLTPDNRTAVMSGRVAEIRIPKTGDVLTVEETVAGFVYKVTKGEEETWLRSTGEDAKSVIVDAFGFGIPQGGGNLVISNIAAKGTDYAYAEVRDYPDSDKSSA